jgi:hypothetical protein
LVSLSKIVFQTYEEAMLWKMGMTR